MVWWLVASLIAARLARLARQRRASLITQSRGPFGSPGEFRAIVTLVMSRAFARLFSAIHLSTEPRIQHTYRVWAKLFVEGDCSERASRIFPSAKGLGMRTARACLGAFVCLGFAAGAGYGQAPCNPVIPCHPAVSVHTHPLPPVTVHTHPLPPVTVCTHPLPPMPMIRYCQRPVPLNPCPHGHDN